MSTASREAERVDLIRALAVLCEKPGPSHPAIASALGLPQPSPVEHSEVFGHLLPPYASVYLDLRGQIGGEARDRIAGFWRAVGSNPPPEPDHLAALLGLWAALVERGLAEPAPERRALIRHSETALVWEHLAAWLPPYLTRVRELGGPAYQEWAGLLGTIIVGAVGDRMPEHLTGERSGPGDAPDFVPFLLTPIRSGLILTRADLSRCAAELSLGIRVGERAYALRSLLDQSAQEAIEWLGGEARRQSRLFLTGAGPETIGRFWSGRAGGTARLLEAMVTTGA